MFERYTLQANHIIVLTKVNLSSFKFGVINLGVFLQIIRKIKITKIQSFIKDIIFCGICKYANSDERYSTIFEVVEDQ